MKCSECRRKIPAARLKARPNVETCSTACSAIRQGKLANERWSAYYRRRREPLADISHEPLVPGTELVVRKGHVVGRKEPGDETWRLVTVLSATRAGRATHVCAPSAWNQKAARKPWAEDQLTRGMKIAVLPPEWALDRKRAVRAEKAGIRFDNWEDLQAAAFESQAGGKAP